MKILFVGETWIINSIHIKGFDHFTTSQFGSGIKWIKEAFISEGIEVDHMAAHDAHKDFPFSVDKLKQYDAVLFSDIGSNTFLLHDDTFVKGVIVPNRLQVIKEYVEGGGGFAMIGGYMSFTGVDGKARYKYTPIESILPVELYPFDDRVERPEGACVEVLDENHPVLKNIDKPFPVFLGYNKLAPKDMKSVIAKTGDDVFLAAHDYGKGKVLVFASDCSPHWAPMEFVNWEYYATFWGNVVRYLSK